MGEKMSLAQVSAMLRNRSPEVLWQQSEAMADAIDAHLTQPAQAVDVEKVREVIADLSRRANTGFNTNDRARCGHWAEQLTLAIASTTPDKDQTR